MTRRFFAGLALSLVTLAVWPQHRARFACWAEPSQTGERVEVIAYPAGAHHVGLGVRVPCPR